MSSERSQCEKASILHDSCYMKLVIHSLIWICLWKRHNYGDNKKSVAAKRWGMEISRQSTKTILNKKQNDGYISKPIICATPRVNTNVNYGLWWIKMCQCGLSIATYIPPWWGILIKGRLCIYGGRGYMGTLFLSILLWN